MKIRMAQFITPLAGFGTTRQSVSSELSGANPGEKAPDLELDEKMRFIAVTLRVNGVMKTRLVPMSNVAHFEPIVEDKPVTPAVKK